MNNYLKFPAPYFGGKSSIAGDVWDALGQPSHYLEPFFGSGAVLLNRPNFDANDYTETVNDADGHICNVWRALQADPDAVAKVCDWPVNHADLMARKVSLNAATATLLEDLCRDDKYYHTELAGYWIWAASCWIGSGLVCPGQIPHLGDAGEGVHAKGQIPHLGDAGKGVHAKGKIPHLGTAGNGVHAKGKIPHLGTAGMGVQEPYTANIYEWFRVLSARLRRVRVVCGDWKRICGGDWQDGNWPSVGYFFDPPYSAEAGRDNALYAVESATVAHDVREWSIERGKRTNYRIVIAGYYDEHASLLKIGWRVKTWSAQGGYGKTAKAGSNAKGKMNRHKEALFFSPHCVDQRNLFEEAE